MRLKACETHSTTFFLTFTNFTSPIALRKSASSTHSTSEGQKDIMLAAIELVITEFVLLAVACFFLLRYYAASMVSVDVFVAVYISWVLGFASVLFLPYDLSVAIVDNERSPSLERVWQFVYWRCVNPQRMQNGINSNFRLLFTVHSSSPGQSCLYKWNIIVRVTFPLKKRYVYVDLHTR